MTQLGVVTGVYLRLNYDIKVGRDEGSICNEDIETATSYG